MVHQRIVFLQAILLAAIMAFASAQDDFPFTDVQFDDPTDLRPTTRVPVTSSRPIVTSTAVPTTTTARPFTTTTALPTTTTSLPTTTTWSPATTTAPRTTDVPSTTTASPSTTPSISTTTLPRATTSLPTTTIASGTTTWPPTTTPTPRATTASPSTTTASPTTVTPTFTTRSPATTTPAPTTTASWSNHSSHEPLYVALNQTGNGTNASAVPFIASPEDIVFCDRVSVERDATYCVAGPICSGRGDAPRGMRCPQAGAVAVAQCVPTLQSYNASLGQCIAPAASVCQKLATTEVWGCVLTA